MDLDASESHGPYDPSSWGDFHLSFMLMGGGLTMMFRMMKLKRWCSKWVRVKSRDLMVFFLFFIKYIGTFLGLSTHSLSNQLLRMALFLLNSMLPLSLLFLKNEVSKLVSQFRPISLCNVLMKIVRKLITNRLKPLMSKLTCSTHSSLQEDRLQIILFLLRKLFIP